MDTGIELLKSIEVIFAILVYTVPAIGTVYKIRRKSDKKMEHTVFIPNPIDKEY